MAFLRRAATFREWDPEPKTGVSNCAVPALKQAHCVADDERAFDVELRAGKASFRAEQRIQVGPIHDSYGGVAAEDDEALAGMRRARAEGDEPSVGQRCASFEVHLRVFVAATLVEAA